MSTIRTSPHHAGKLVLAVLTASAFLLTLAGSALKNTIQVYFLPITSDFGGSRADLAWAITLFSVTTAIFSPLVGSVADRIGGARTLAVGSFLAGLAMLGCALSGPLWLFIVIYAVVAALALTMLSYVPLGVFVDELFQDGRKGLIYALITNGGAVGFIVLVPLWTWLGEWWSWRAVLGAIGVVFLVVLTPLAMVVTRQSGRVTSPEGNEARPVEAVASPSFGSQLRMCFRSKELRLLGLAFVGCGFTMAFIDVHFVPFMADHHMGNAVSSSAIALLGTFEIIGSLLAGWLCDRGLVKSVLVGAYVTRAVAMLLLVLAPSSAMALLFGTVFGLSYLASVIATSMWIARVLPVSVRGTAMGLVWMVHALGVALSSQFGAVMQDRTHSYVPVILSCAVLTAVAALTVLAANSARPAVEGPKEHDDPTRPDLADTPAP